MAGSGKGPLSQSGSLHEDQIWLEQGESSNSPCMQTPLGAESSPEGADFWPAALHAQINEKCFP